MSGRLAIIGLTLLAFLALGAGTTAVPTTAAAEFRVPGLFGGTKKVKRRRYRRPAPVQPVRNPDRTFAAVSAKAVSPDVAKNSLVALSVGAAAEASVVMMLPAPKRTAAADADAKDEPEAKTVETKTVETKTAETKSAETEAADADAKDEPEAETKTADAAADETAKADDKSEDKAERADATPADSDKATDEKTAEPDKSDDGEETNVAADDTAKKPDAVESDDAKTAEQTASGDAADDEVSEPKLADDGADKDKKVASEEDEPDTADGEKATESKTADAEAGDTKATEAKTAETKSADTKTAETEMADTAAADDGASEESTPANADADSLDAKETASADTADEAPTETAEADDGADPAPKTATSSEEDADTATKAAAATAAAIAAKVAAESKDAADTEETAETGDADKAADADDSDTTDAETKTADAADSETATSNAKPEEAKADEAKSEDSKTADAESEDTNTEGTQTEDTKTADANGADSDKEADTKDVADGAADAAGEDESSAGEIVTASLPPAPEPKPEIARMASPANTPERLAADEADAQTEEASSDGDGEITASIEPTAPAGGIAASDEAPDVTDVTRASADAPQEDEIVLDPRAYDATVILDVSPPPGAKSEGDDTKVAALEPGSVPLASSEPALDGEADTTADVGPPPPPPVDPVIAAVRTKLDGSAAPKIADADLDALKAVYGERDDYPLWVADGGLTPKAKSLIATIRDADDWGLDADAYSVPSSGDTLTTDEAKADAELALSAAVLKYARHAQTGRLTPSKAHKLFDFNPTARDPKEVLTEIAASGTPDKSLLALHPQSEQYQRLHTALVHARDSAKDLGRNPDTDHKVQLIAINMERWRWLPSDLGDFHVWNNIPEFKFRVLKNGREIYEEKTIVGQTKYATAFFSAPMRNIVFNPNWTVPPTIVKEDIAPKLKGPQRSGGFFGGRESRNRMLRRYGLTVSKGGQPVDADQVDWQSANVHTYTFQQDPGPHNVLGQFKFNFPNKHAIYMHDTTQKELFGNQVRTLSHGCIRVNQPARFAAFLLGEDKGWTMGTVQDVLARAQGQTKVISLSRKIPVHLTYNTAIADGRGSIREFGDVYGIDNRMAAQLFKNPAHFNVPYSSPELAETTPTRRYSESSSRRPRRASGVDNFLSGILGN